MATIAVISSEVLDRVAHLLVRDPQANMANASLLRWYSKVAAFERDPLLETTDDLLSYVSDGVAPDRLARLVSDFPAMFSWFGRDIVSSEQAAILLGRIRALLAQANAGDFEPHDFCEPAAHRLDDYHVLSATEELLGLHCGFPELRLVVVRDLWDPFYVMPSTVVCFQDDTYSTYVAMVAHETTHALSLSLVNDPDVTAGIPPQVAHPMAEALAQAVQMLMIETCGIWYGDLFPGGSIMDHRSYLHAHPERTRMEPMIVRIMGQLRERHGRPLRQIYRNVLEEFAGASPQSYSSSAS